MSFKQLATLTALALAISGNAAIIPAFPYRMQARNPNSTIDGNVDLTSGGTGNCWTAASSTDGASVTLQKCQAFGTASQSWVFSASAPSTPGTGGVGTIKVFGNKCLDVTDGVDASGTKLQIYGCSTANKNQQWQVTTRDEDSLLNGILNVQWVNSTKCIDLTGGSQADGTPLQLLDCQTDSTDQKWISQYMQPAPPSATQLFRLYSADQVDTEEQYAVVARSDVDNDPAVMFPDNEQNFGQNWLYEGGALKSYDGTQCLDVTGGVDADGTKLQTFSCTSGNTNQQWVFNSDFSIQWKGHNKCIDLTDGNVTFGNQLQVWTCASGNTNRKWRIDPAFNPIRPGEDD